MLQLLRHYLQRKFRIEFMIDANFCEFLCKQTATDLQFIDLLIYLSQLLYYHKQRADSTPPHSFYVTVLMHQSPFEDDNLLRTVADPIPVF